MFQKDSIIARLFGILWYSLLFYRIIYRLYIGFLGSSIFHCTSNDMFTTVSGKFQLGGFSCCHLSIIFHCTSDGIWLFRWKGWYLRKFQLIGFSCCHLSTLSRLRPVFPISSSKSWVGSSSSLESSFMKVEFLNVKPKMSKREFSFLLLWFYTSTNVPRSLEASKRHLKRQSLKQEVNHRDVKWQWYVCQVLLLFFYSLSSPLLFCYFFL